MSPDQAVGVLFKAKRRTKLRTAERKKYMFQVWRGKIPSSSSSGERSLFHLEGPVLRFVRLFVTCSDTIPCRSTQIDPRWHLVWALNKNASYRKFGHQILQSLDLIIPII